MNEDAVRIALAYARTVHAHRTLRDAVRALCDDATRRGALVDPADLAKILDNTKAAP